MIIDHPIFTEMLLPFLLVFVLMFAILQKTKILGEKKAQIDALVSLAIALILIGFRVPRMFIVELMPWLAVGAAVILVFLILYGFVAGDLSKAPKWMKITFGILAGVFTLGVVLYVSGWWASIFEWLGSGVGEGIWMELVLLVIVVVAVLVVVLGKKDKGKDDD